jgi:hypothetical protein
VDVLRDLGEAREKGELEDAHVVTVDMDDNPYLDARPRSASWAACRRRSAAPARRGASSTSAASSTASSSATATSSRRSPSQPSTRNLRPFDDQLVYVGIDPGQRFMAAAVFVAVAMSTGR